MKFMGQMKLKIGVFGTSAILDNFHWMNEAKCIFRFPVLNTWLLDLNTPNLI